MKSMSNEKRELIIVAKERGKNEKDISEWLNVSVRSVSRIWKLHRDTESIQPKKRPGRKPSLDDAKMEQIRTAIKKQPDMTLEELIDEFNLPIKKSRLAVILSLTGLSFKKRLYLRKNS
jgi:transposase